MRLREVWILLKSSHTLQRILIGSAILVILLAVILFASQSPTSSNSQLTTRDSLSSVTSSFSSVTSSLSSVTQSLEPAESQVIVLGTQPNASRDAVTVIPASQLVWVTYNMPNSSFVEGAEAVFRLNPQNYGSNVSIAVYVNGKLLNVETYEISPLSSPVGGTPVIYQTALEVPIQQTIVGDSSVTFAILSQTPITTYVTNAGLTYVSVVDSIPRTIPTSASSSLPFTLEIYAYTGK